MLLGEPKGVLRGAEGPRSGRPIAGGGEGAARGPEEDCPDPPRADEVENLCPDVVTGEVVEAVRVAILVDDVDVDALPPPLP